MKSLYLTAAFSLVLLAFIPFRAYMACSPSAPLYTHFVYMFAHASIIHWLCNSWSLLVFHNLFRPSRLISAYALSVLVSFLLPVMPLMRNKPIIGLSVIVCFFMGFYARRLYSLNRLALFLSLALLLLSCFLPGFAGIFHIIMFALGFLYYPVERVYRNYQHYRNHP